MCAIGCNYHPQSRGSIQIMILPNCNFGLKIVLLLLLSLLFAQSAFVIVLLAVQKVDFDCIIPLS